MLSATIGQVEFNTTLNGETYWAFLRGIGYTSLSSIPPDCLIPAPWQELPTQVNLGALTLNESMALYLGWLKSMGTFYGSSGSFSVCTSGKLVTGWTWLNETYAFVPGTAEYGGAYLNNGTAPINVQGKHLASETLANMASWALPVTAASAGQPGVGPYLAAQGNGTSSSSGAISSAAVNVTTGETVLVEISALGTPGATVTDSAGNTFARFSTNELGTTLDTLYTCNSTSKSGASDVISGTEVNGGNIRVFVFSSASGIMAGTVVNLASGTGPTRTVFSWTDSNTGDTVLFANGYGGSQNWTNAPGATDGNYKKVQGNLQSLAWVRPSIMGATSWYFGQGAQSGQGSAVTIQGLGAIPAVSASNTSLIIVPTIKSVSIPQGKLWPVPADNPLYVFYATQNKSQGASEGNWTILNVAYLTGNGTSNGTSDAFPVGGTPGDTLYLTGCESNYTYDTGACAIAITNWTTYVVNVLCGSACQNVNPSTGPGMGSCGSGLLGTLENWFASIFGTSGLGCFVSEVVAIVFLIIVAVLVIWIIAAVVRR
jgi:hypothetical protein